MEFQLFLGCKWSYRKGKTWGKSCWTWDARAALNIPCLGYPSLLLAGQVKEGAWPSILMSYF